MCSKHPGSSPKYSDLTWGITSVEPSFSKPHWRFGCFTSRPNHERQAMTKVLLRNGAVLRKSLLATLAIVALSFAPTTAHATDGLAESISALPPEEMSTSIEQTIDDLLEELSGTQSDEEIDALVTKGNTTVLVDSATGEQLSAVHHSTSGLSPQAISWLSPGCGTSGRDVSACIVSGGKNFG